MNCEFCNNTFGTKYSLQAHQKRAKYCLSVQKKANSYIVSELVKCNYCYKSFSPHNMERHYDSCKQKLKKRIEELEKLVIEKDIQIAELKSGNNIYKELSDRELSCVEDIARQPRTQNNNTQNNLMMLSPLNLNKEAFAETIRDSFTKDYFLQGQKGVARFAVEKLLRDSDGKLKYVCTDPSRQVYRFKTLDG